MTCHASSPMFIRPAASPAVLIWMRGSRGWYALQTSDVPLIGRGEMRRWKIAAPLVGLYFAGVAIAGTLPSQTESGSAAETIESQEPHAFQPRDLAEVPLPIVSASGAAHENGSARAFYYRLYHQKRQGVSGGVLSIGSLSGAALVKRDSYESYDRKRRQFTSPHFDLPRPTRVVEQQIAPRTGSASPKHRLHVQAPRRSVDYPHASSEQDHISYSSGGVSDISTSSVSKLPPVEQAEVITRGSEIAEKHASIDFSVIPIPIRKPPKAIKSTKAVTAKATAKKAAARCRNRIWRC